MSTDGVPEANPADLQEQADPVETDSHVIVPDALTDDIEVDEADQLEQAQEVPASRDDELRETP